MSHIVNTCFTHGLTPALLTGFLMLYINCLWWTCKLNMTSSRLSHCLLMLCTWLTNGLQKVYSLISGVWLMHKHMQGHSLLDFQVRNMYSLQAGNIHVTLIRTEVYFTHMAIYTSAGKLHTVDTDILQNAVLETFPPIRLKRRYVCVKQDCKLMKTLSTLHGLVKMSEAQFLPQGSIRDTNSLDHQRDPIWTCSIHNCKTTTTTQPDLTFFGGRGDLMLLLKHETVPCVKMTLLRWLTAAEVTARSNWDFMPVVVDIPVLQWFKFISLFIALISQKQKIKIKKRPKKRREEGCWGGHPFQNLQAFSWEFWEKRRIKNEYKNHVLFCFFKKN